MVGLKAKLKVIISILSVFLIAPITTVSAKEAKTDFVTCDAYTEFLEGKSGNIQASKCDSLTKLIIDNRKLDRARFAIKVSEYSTEHSAYYQLSKGLVSFIYKDAKKVYMFLDIAHPMIYHSFKRLNDDVRATVYTALIIKLKNEAITASFQKGSEFLKDYHISDLAKEYGAKYSVFDTEKPIRNLMCLLKTDNLVVDFNKVLNSEVFKKCMP